MIVYVLVIWFGVGGNQSSFSVNGIVSAKECMRLGDEIKRNYPLAEGKCYPYRVPAKA